jgi:NADH-quinone oxidoreductase subunit L
MSQIGYMTLAAGLGPAGYVFAIAHLLAHGFFKAGLFLGAGSVMHGMNEEVDMRKYGGLARVMPITAITFGIGYLALIGFPGLSGFFTKDKIIEAAYDVGGTSGWILGTCALLGALLTAFYMTRLMAMTFFGKRRWAEDVHPHESPATMTVPMIVLAIGSLGAGAYLTVGQRLVHWLEPVTGFKESTDHTISPNLLTVITIVAMLLGVALAWLFVARRPVPVTPPPASAIVVAARKNLYGDALNEALIARPGTWLDRALVFTDNKGVDGMVNGLAALFGGGSGRLRRLQTGFVRSYALSMLGGAVLLVAALLMVRFS